MRGLNKSITREQIVVAKRVSMEMYFWIACALDDDNGFDRLMAMKNRSDLDNAEWGGVFLSEHIKDLDFSIVQIRNHVFDSAVRLLCNLCGATRDIAVTVLQRERTTEVLNGAYTKECQLTPHHHDVSVDVTAAAWAVLADFGADYGEKTLIGELYDEQPALREALLVLIPGFEYPDWASRTIEDVRRIGER